MSIKHYNYTLLTTHQLLSRNFLMIVITNTSQIKNITWVHQDLDQVHHM